MELITEKIKNFETEEYAKAYGRAIGLKYDTEVVLVAGEKVVLCGTSYPSEEDISQDIEDLFNRLKGEYQIEGSNSDDCDVINRVTKIISEYFEKGYGLKFVKPHMVKTSCFQHYHIGNIHPLGVWTAFLP